MLYADYLQDLHDCPFCNDPGRILIDAKNCYLTYALAPYHKHHLLIVPKQHKISLFDLNSAEKDDLNALTFKAMLIMRRLGYADFSIIAREGDNTTKTISHLHYHIIPNTHIGDLDHKNIQRRLLTKDEIKDLTKDINSAINSSEVSE